MIIEARINDCHRRLNYFNNKIQQRLDKLKQLIPTTLLSTIQTIADSADKITDQHRKKEKQKLTRLQDTKNAKWRIPNANWVRNISSHSLDEIETEVQFYGLNTRWRLNKYPLIRLLYLALRPICFVNTSHQNRPRIISEVEWPLLCNQPQYRTAPWLLTNRKHWSDYRNYSSPKTYAAHQSFFLWVPDLPTV